MPLPVKSFSVLDKFFADAPASLSTRTPAHVALLLKGIERDLEDLLNTRLTDEAYSRFVKSGAAVGEARVSPLAYGVLDYADAGQDGRIGDRIKTSIEHAVRTFEPRLSAVRLVPPAPPDGRPGNQYLLAKFVLHARTTLADRQVQVVVRAATDANGRTARVAVEAES